MNTVSSTQTRMWIHTHNSQSRRDSTRPNSYTCPDSNWGQRRETTGWFLSCARGKRSFPPSSLAFPNSWANFSIVNWDKLQCYLANLNLSGNGGCSDKKNREVQGTRKSIRKKKTCILSTSTSWGSYSGDSELVLLVLMWDSCRMWVHILQKNYS